MNEKDTRIQEETLAQLDRLIREASPAEIIDFVEQMTQKRPELHALLMEKLQKQRKSLPSTQ